VTLLDEPIAATSAEQRAAENLRANLSALGNTQPELAEAVLPPREMVEWVYGRDGALTALDERGDWWSGCSIPFAAGSAMLKKMSVEAAVSCFLAPPHAAHLRITLDRFSAEQAIIAVVPEERDVRVLLACEDFSGDIAAHRLWFAAGENWAEVLESILEEQVGLAVPGQFVRLLSTDEGLIQKLIGEATGVFSRLTARRSELIGELGQSPAATSAAGREINRLGGLGTVAAEAATPAEMGRFEYVAANSRRFCVMAPTRFRLWSDEGKVLAENAPQGSVLLDTSDPALSSPLKLARMAVECGALLTPNFGRADLAGAVPMEVPWFTWVTNDRIPGFNLAGPGDRLLVVGEAVRRAAIAAGWPGERVHLAGWPVVKLPAAKGKRKLTVLGDTVVLRTPEDLEDFSSHRVLWETIQRELAADPFALEGDPGDYLASRMRRFEVSDGAFGHGRFLSQLIVPGYQQGVVRAIIRAGVGVELFGEGWGEIEEISRFAAGAVRSHEEKEAVLAGAEVLVDLWPWRAGHPIGGVDRVVIRRERGSLAGMVQRAKLALGGVMLAREARGAKLSAGMLAGLLGQAV
jgi:hypothetical protein